MALSAFDDKSKQPRKENLKRVLGRAAAHWDSLVAHVASELPPLEESLNFSGASWGWALRLRHKKRTILYMTPCKGHFIVGFALGEKAVEAAHDSSLPASIIKAIDEARKYAEGRAVRIEVKSKRELEAVKKLTSIKMAN
jgi:hypothetical protein